MIDHNKYMLDTIALSVKNVKNNGGPFAAIIVKDQKIIAKACNSVTADNDPTAHAEVNVIRKASRVLNTFDLSDCTIYTSCEPCPMCLGAIYWARIKKVFYGNTKTDARNIGFDDSFIYDEIDMPIDKRKVEFIQLLAEKAKQAFIDWDNAENKMEY